MKRGKLRAVIPSFLLPFTLCTTLLALFLALPCAAQSIPVGCSIGYEGANPSNNIVLTWESVPTKLYNVMTTPALGQQLWQVLNPTPIYSTNNLVRYRDRNDQSARFYKTKAACG